MSKMFARAAGLASALVALGGLLYGLLFAYIVAGAPRIVGEFWYALLMLGGLFSVFVLAGLYRLLRDVDTGFALTALLLGVLAALGGLLHGASGLAQLLGATGKHAPPDPDVAGVLRYGIQGAGLLVIGWLMIRSRAFPRALGWIAGFGGALLVLIYAGRLYQFITPASKVSLVPPLLYGLVVHPVFYLWVARVFRRAPAVVAPGA